MGIREAWYELDNARESDNKESIYSLLDSLLTESKADIQNFIDKFGEDTYNEFIKAKQRFKNKGVSVDLTYHIKNTTPEEMKNLLYNTNNTVARSLDSDADLKATKHIRGKYEDLGMYKGYHVYRPLDYLASMDLGIGTGWCTAGRYKHYGHTNFAPSGRDAQEHFDKYTANGIELYYFLDPNTMEGKYAIALGDLMRHDINKVIKDLYIRSINFKIYNAKDEEDYSKMSLALALPKDKVKWDVAKDFLLKDGVYMDTHNNILSVDKKADRIIVPEDAKIDASNRRLFDDCKASVIDVTGMLTNINDRYFYSEMFQNCENVKVIKFSRYLFNLFMPKYFKYCTSLEDIKVNGKSVEPWYMDEILKWQNSELFRRDRMSRRDRDN